MASERGTISAEATLRLWVAAGGRCEYRGCNTYLLEDELSGYELNLAERAHIVGATQGPGSPRGEGSLDPSLRNDEPNLMLLCRNHHRVIDRLIKEHGVKELIAMKCEHEERVRLLTELSEDAATVIVRVIGGIRGAPVEIPPAAVQKAVIADGRFPRFRAVLAGEDLEIDLRALPNEEGHAYWEAGEQAIKDHSARLLRAQDAIGHVSVFALARMPFLVALGYHLDDKLPVTVYPRQRGGAGDGEWGFEPNASPTAFDQRRLGGPDGDRVALAVSLTGPIGEEVLGLASDSAVYEIEPAGVRHSRNLFAARKSLDAFAEIYHSFLATIERDHPACKEIDVYLAAPAPAAVQIGRGVMRNSQPTLIVHDRNSSGSFEPTLRLGDHNANP